MDYLWLDTEILLCWSDGKLERIERNGSVTGIKPDSEYPVREIPIHSGDRKLQEIVRSDQSLPTSRLSEQILSGISQWRLDSVPQQDDITLITQASLGDA